jgi:hypothetical protein
VYRTPTIGATPEKKFLTEVAMSDHPMVALNRAVAAAMVHGPNKGLEPLEALEADAGLAGHHRLDAVRAHLLELGGAHNAIAHCRAASAQTASLPGYCSRKPRGSWAIYQQRANVDRAEAITRPLRRQ